MSRFREQGRAVVEPCCGQLWYSTKMGKLERSLYSPLVQFPSIRYPIQSQEAGNVSVTALGLVIVAFPMPTLRGPELRKGRKGGHSAHRARNGCPLKRARAPVPPAFSVR
ncbi:hypothetical protein EVAR_95679_1 [Eumeta japonica]|uniref:Uncharacterized protein n=1 Tax=Eumeta variegata TaxID=151549 RepID=A0A4C1VJZ5_EUMVA|nr:hypothetical protein EVAR_95679_1 [Eumeta japonica]